MKYVRQIKEEKPNKIKQFIVVARGGHCGDGYFVPVVLPIWGKNLEHAEEMALEIPRIKHDQKGAIICAEERTGLETYLAKFIMDRDPYFTSKDVGPSKLDDIKVVSPLRVDAMYKELYDGRIPRIVRENKNFYVKTADQFEKRYVLQRHTAPKLIDGKLVFPKRINMDKLLVEYFTQKVKELVVDTFDASKFGDNVVVAHGDIPVSENVYKKFDMGDGCAPCSNFDEYFSMNQILLIYFRLFGRNNPLGIRYYNEGHKLSFMTKEGDVAYVKIPQMSVEEFNYAYPNSDYNVFTMSTRKNLEHIVFDSRNVPVFKIPFVSEDTQEFSDDVVVRNGRQRFEERYGKHMLKQIDNDDEDRPKTK